MRPCGRCGFLARMALANAVTDAVGPHARRLAGLVAEQTAMLSRVEAAAELARIMSNVVCTNCIARRQFALRRWQVPAVFAQAV